MFRNMRREKQALSEEELNAILTKNTYGILSVNGDDGYPYSVPLNYVYAHRRIYFHCAQTGHKIDAIKADGKVSFCVVDRADIVMNDFSTTYKSVIVFGRAAIVEDEAKKRHAIEYLTKALCPTESDEHIWQAVNHEMPVLCIVEITPERITGKMSRDLAANK